jgi:hypothetical protein
MVPAFDIIGSGDDSKVSTNGRTPTPHYKIVERGLLNFARWSWQSHRRITDTVTQTNSLIVHTVLSRHWRESCRILAPCVHFTTLTAVASPFHGVLLSKNSFAICANDYDERSNSHHGNIREPASFRIDGRIPPLVSFLVAQIILRTFLLSLFM